MAGLAILAAVVLALCSLINGAFPWPRQHRTYTVPASSRMAANFTKVGPFQQLLDHERPELGTFSQHFWASDLYVRKGVHNFPVILAPTGERAGVANDMLLSDNTLYGAIAKETGAAMVVLEHRYYGGSSPFDALTTENLQHLTLRNAIADLVHFARTVALPFDPAGRSRAPHAPWILAGCSYAGALSAWTATTAPGTFWAHHAASAPVEAVEDFWRYFEPVQTHMPRNCSRDVARVIEYVDACLEHCDARGKAVLKEGFGLGPLTHDGDFASALQLPLWEWQGNTFTTGYSSFYEFCDYVENVPNPKLNRDVPDAEGVGLEKAMTGFARWLKESFLPGYCKSFWHTTEDPSDLSCLKFHDPNNTLFTDLNVENGMNRQWQWLLCNEPLGWWQTAAPPGSSNLVSHLVTVDYWASQCDLQFSSPEKNYPMASNGTAGRPVRASAADVNAFTGGWTVRAPPSRSTLPPSRHAQQPRIMFLNGEADSWTPATVSARERPGGPLVSTATQPVIVVPEGNHCSVMLKGDYVANEGVAHAWNLTVSIMKTWVDEFYAAGEH